MDFASSTSPVATQWQTVRDAMRQLPMRQFAMRQLEMQQLAMRQLAMRQLAKRQLAMRQLAMRRALLYLRMQKEGGTHENHECRCMEDVTKKTKAGMSRVHKRTHTRTRTHTHH